MIWTIIFIVVGVFLFLVFIEPILLVAWAVLACFGVLFEDAFFAVGELFGVIFSEFDDGVVAFAESIKHNRQVAMAIGSVLLLGTITVLAYFFQ